jgi:hypothetical protein
MTEADGKVMMTILRDLQAGQTEMKDRMTSLSEEVRATRRVLLDAFVQLEMRVARIEAQP